MGAKASESSLRHWADRSATLERVTLPLQPGDSVPEAEIRAADVVLVCLTAADGLCPSPVPNAERLASSPAAPLFRLTSQISTLLGPEAVLAVFDTPSRLPIHHAFLGQRLFYKVWLVVRVETPEAGPHSGSQAAGSVAPSFPLPCEHAGLLLYGRSTAPLRHADLRIAYEICPACGRTTKDYGGKRHLYPAFGTLSSDVWKDVAVPRGVVFPEVAIRRLQDLLSVTPRTRMLCLGVQSIGDAAALPLPEIDWEQPFRGIAVPGATLTRGRRTRGPIRAPRAKVRRLEAGTLCHGDVLDALGTLESGSVDFVFADPPYNLAKRYAGYSDSLEIQDYFGWCDRWISAVERVLKPGGYFALLNLPLWSIRHFLRLHQTMRFRRWIAWEALSQPVRRIMPAHYALLIFSAPGAVRGEAPWLSIDRVSAEGLPDWIGDPEDLLRPIAPGYCRRPSCRNHRVGERPDPRGLLTDLWADIHRVKHNTRRRDHPCQLPPQLLARLILLLTRPGDRVLDPFNGIGTTTLCASALHRRFIGIELDKGYHVAAIARHEALGRGENPFAKGRAGSRPTVKNNPTPRTALRVYEVSKRALQLEILRLAEDLGRIPSRDDVAVCSRFPLRYYDEYFRTWSEAVAAVRAARVSRAARPPGQ